VDVRERVRRNYGSRFGGWRWLAGAGEDDEQHDDGRDEQHRGGGEHRALARADRRHEARHRLN